MGSGISESPTGKGHFEQQLRGSTGSWAPGNDREPTQHLRPDAQSLQHLQALVVDDGQHQAVHDQHAAQALHHVDDEVAWGPRDPRSLEALHDPVIHVPP